MGKPFDPLEDRRREAAASERVDARGREEAFKQGVVETAGRPVIFVNPDNIREIDMRFSQRPPYTRNPGYSLERQLEGQVPGAANAVKARVNEHELDPVSMNQIARAIKQSGPAALTKIDIGGVEYGLVIMPSGRMDTKKEMVDDFFSHLDRKTRQAIAQNTPGTDSQWMRLIGNHEGEHINDPNDEKNPVDVLREEVRADRSANNLALARGEADVALAFKDFRALRAFGDPKHASGPLLLSHDPVEALHFREADNSTYHMERAVRYNFDWGSYTGKARTPEDLLKENPEGYFAAAQKGLDAYQTKVMDEYNADPTSLKTQGAVIEAQVRIDYHKDFEDAWRRRVLGQDVPERAPTQLITQEQEDAYLAEAKFQDRVKAEGSEVATEALSAYPLDRILQDVDWSKVGEGIEGPDDLEASDPVRFHELVRERLDVLKEAAVAQHAADPSYENLERLVQLDLVVNVNEYDLAMERHFQNTDPAAKFEAPGPANIVSPEQRHSYYEQRFAQKDAGTWVKPEPYVVPEAPEASEAAPIFALPGVIPEAESLVAAEALLVYNDELIFEGIDWDKVDGPATSADELFVQNPMLYTEIAAQQLTVLSEKVLGDYQANPSYENLEKVVQIEMAMNQTNVYLAAHQGAQDPSVPYQEPAPVSLISEGERAGYYYGRMQEEAFKAAPVGPEAAEPEVEGADAAGAAADAPVESAPKELGSAVGVKNYTQGVDGTAYTAVVSGLQAGAPKVDFGSDCQLSVAGLSMGNVFAQSADPDPGSVSLVNARMSAPEEVAGFVPPTVQVERTVGLGAPA